MSSLLESEAPFEAGLAGFFHRQLMVHRKPVPADTDLTGQVAIITGSNGGLGFEAGRQLLQLGLSHLILAVRSQAKGDQAADRLRNEFPAANISVWLLDMESYDSISAFAERCQTLPHIDVVLLNAGLQAATFRIVEATGHEQSFQVNYLSTVLLTILLLPVLQAKRPPQAKPAVLSIVTSDTAHWAKLETQGPILAQFDRAEGHSAMQAYSQEKLLQHFFVAKLTEQISPEDGVIVNMVNPGLCTGTSFGQDDGWSLIGVFFGILKSVIARTVEVGASTYVDAVVVKGRESHGSFVSDWAIRPYPKVLYTAEGDKIKERLWEETMEELNFAGASKTVQDLKQKR
ncbi:Uu.00g132420.m01.CDS01 [Anthostomella pinea]|uniref:Uu.00g132420.m01.CDS01 n=1 Tax=Anthostomella pinea TaxID=933095 RepID=A0AAI8YFY5_9PEZI|nr:Uu.00g132420.m01.CDS01 [Anthostomella pinea]